MQEMQFDRVGVFQYSHEESTIAYEVADDVSAELKAERSNRLMAVQQEISLAKNEAKVGKTFRVLIDRKEGEYFVGRTAADSPEVDNEVLINAAETYVRIGDFVQITITDANDYDLFGTIATS